LLSAGLVVAGTLDERAALARRMEMESVLAGDAHDSDSLSASQLVQKKGKTPGKLKSPLAQESMSPDSLLSAPLPVEWDTVFVDSVYQDSTGKSHRLQRRLLRPAVPKRYEQRIFQSADRSAFMGSGGMAGGDYRLGPGDQITVSLWGDKEKEYELILNHDGKIFLEGVGQVPIGGQDLVGAKQVLKQRLAKVYSGITRGTTQIDVTLGKPGPSRVFVLGEVKMPGGYVFSGQSGILTALYFAKGPSDIGTVRNLQLTRSGTKYALDLYQYLFRGEAMSPHTLQDGDILYSGRAECLVDISGDIGRPAVYELKKGEGVKELLEYAGGLNATAANHKLTIQRIFPNGKPGYLELASPQEYLSGKTKTELMDGDKILVEKSSEEAVDFLSISGPVKYPGKYQAAGVRTVQELIARAGGLREDAFLGRIHVLRMNPEGSSKLFAYSMESAKPETIGLQPKDRVVLYSLKDMYLPDSVEISGAVFNPGRFEYRGGMTVKDLIMQAGGLLPHHEAGRALVFRGTDREHAVEQIPLTMSDSLSQLEDDFSLKPSDFVQIPIDPKWYTKEIVSLEGLFVHPGKYALLYPGETITSVIERAGGFKSNAYVEGGRFYRSKDSVNRIGIDIRHAVDRPRSKSNIPMVGGDSIFIPERLNTVKVIGEVGFETSVLLNEGASVGYYIDHAGGFTRRSEKDRVVVQYANGETSRGGGFDRKPDAGSTIYVPQGPEPKQTDWIAGINVLLGTLGVAAALILSIQAISSK